MGSVAHGRDFTSIGSCLLAAWPRHCILPAWPAAGRRVMPSVGHLHASAGLRLLAAEELVGDGLELLALLGLGDLLDGLGVGDPLQLGARAQHVLLLALLPLLPLRHLVLPDLLLELHLAGLVRALQRLLYG
ncbi:unnamed protein product [Urochloa humidicola]